MPDMITDGISWHDLALAGGAILFGLVTYIVSVFTKRLDTHEAEDLTRFTQLFSTQTTIADKIATGFRELDQTISGIHVKLLEEINKPHHRADD